MDSNKLLQKRHLAVAISALMAGGALAQEPIEEVTVTGSRIVRRDLTAPSPILTVTSENIINSSSTGVETVLNQLPQFVPAGTEFGGGIQNGATNSPGAATLNMRGMGTNRNLVLIDGRRAQPVNASLVVDVNTIPASAIASVEVITGGASAVYGPDALAGVTNFILKDDFEGIEIGMQTGQASEGDGAESNFNMLIGLNADDGRGNIMVGLDWTQRDQIFQRDRDFYMNGWTDPGNAGGQFMQPSTWGAGEGAIPGGRNPPSQDAVDALFSRYGVAPGTVGANSEFRFNPDGSIFVTQGGIGYNGPLNCMSDCGPYTAIKLLDNGNLDQVNTTGFLSTPLERHSAFMRGRYEITEGLSAFMQGNFSDIEVGQRGGIPPAITVWQAPIPRDGRALPDDLNTLLDSRANPDGHWSLYRVLDYNGPIQATNKNEVWQLQAGVDGEVGESITWEAYVSTGETDIEAVNDRMPSLQRYQSLVAQPDFGRGGFFRGLGRGYSQSCPSGLPVFEQFTPDVECVESFDSRMINKSVLTQDIIEFNMQGAGFNLPGGESGWAVGASSRDNSYAFRPGNPVNHILDNPVGIFASNATGGETDVTEFYGEMLLPVIDQFSLELGYRYSDFNTAGGHDTYKTLFTWDATESVTFRGGYQFATRAPNVAELFTAATQVVVFHPEQDPCSVTTRSAWGNVPDNPDREQVIDLCRAIIGNNTSGFDTQTYSITGIAGPKGFHRQNPPFFPLEIELRQGNPDVGPETGDTYTFGAVWTEAFGADGLTLTADIYRIELTDAISPIAAWVVYNNCFNWDGQTNPSYDVNNQFCQMIRRNPSSGDRSEVDAPFFNLGLVETTGVDINVNWIKDIGPGTFSVNSIINYLDNYQYQVVPSQNAVDATGTLDQGGMYEIQALTRFGYSWNNLSLGVTWRHLDAIESASKASSPNTTIQGTGSYDMFNFYGSYSWNQYTVRFGVDNVLDEDPRVIGANPAGGDTNSNITLPALYDVIGRQYFVGLTANF